MPNETLQISEETSAETSTLYLHDTNFSFGGTEGQAGFPPVSGHKLTISATKKDDFCTVTITLSRELGIYFNYHYSGIGRGHIVLTTLPEEYRPTTAVYAIGQMASTDVASQVNSSWGGFFIATDGKIYQHCSDNFSITNPTVNIKSLYCVLNYTISGEDYEADGILGE